MYEVDLAASQVLQNYRLGRQAFSEGSCVPSSPRDSGYGSKPATPDKLLSPQGSSDFGCCNVFDGNGSSDLLLDVDDARTSRPRRVLERSATLPRLNRRSRRGLPAAFFSNRVPKSARRSSDVGASSLRRPDRFVPMRDHSTPLGQKFRTTKATHELTTPEKLLRHHAATPDAFCYRPRRVTPAGRADSRSDSGVASRSRAATWLGPSSVNMRADETFTRPPSFGSVWSVGGVAPSGGTIEDGHGNFLVSGTNAPLFTAAFPFAREESEAKEKHKSRLAAALDIDLVSRVLDCKAFENRPMNPAKTKLRAWLAQRKTFWDGTTWVKESQNPKPQKPLEIRSLPVAPFKVLDAPNLRDDFYCSVLAYSPTCHTLAVGLGDYLYSWSEPTGVRLLNPGNLDGTWLTSLAFSSTQGCKSILAYGRSNCKLGLLSMYEGGYTRIVQPEPFPIACLAWRPCCTVRPSRNPSNPGVPVPTEDLLVGDEAGHISYYVVEWPDKWEIERDNWYGQLTLMARITVHHQQVCGLSWSRNGELFASGANDNFCCLFEVDKVLRSQRQDAGTTGLVSVQSVTNHYRGAFGGTSTQGFRGQVGLGDVQLIHHAGPGIARCRWEHGAAVKAIAFCPWQDGLVATGGGSNDKCIHFFHTTTGAVLATISVCAQVTSLIWSTTRREIAATFGYAQPEHAVRVAVFSWPECKQVAAIPWEGRHRALYAIAYPKVAHDASDPSSPPGRRSRSVEGCIIVAASDDSIKFHEVWAAEDRATTGGAGMLGGSDILEGLEGIDKEGDIIR